MLFQCDHQMTSVSKLTGTLQTGKKVLQCLCDKRQIHTIKEHLKTGDEKADHRHFLTALLYRTKVLSELPWLQRRPRGRRQKDSKVVAIHQSTGVVEIRA